MRLITEQAIRHVTSLTMLQTRCQGSETLLIIPETNHFRSNEIKTDFYRKEDKELQVSKDKGQTLYWAVVLIIDIALRK